MASDIEKRSLKLTSRQQFSMVCTRIDHRNDVKNSSFTVKFSLNILTSFLGSIRVRSMENHSLSICFYKWLWKLSENRLRKKRKSNCATIMSFPWPVFLSNIFFDKFSAQEITQLWQKCFRRKCGSSKFKKNEILVTLTN